MRVRRLSRFRPRRNAGAKGGLWSRLQLRSGAVLLALSCLAIAALLAAVPITWDLVITSTMGNGYTEHYLPVLDKVEQHWKSLPHLSAFTRGDEPHVKAFLTQQPLLVAALDRWETRTIWLRHGDRMVKASENPYTERLRRWFTEAEASQRFEWVPAAESDPDAERACSIVLLGDRWIVAKRWAPGSPEVERMLRQLYDPKPPFRVCLRRLGTPDNAPLEPWGAEPSIQADPARLVRSAVSMTVTSSSFEGWDISAFPYEKNMAAYGRARSRHLWGSTGVAALVGLCLALGLWLRYRAKRRALLDGDRLASLTHSLKTPLAILKFRCDSIRLGRLEPDLRDAELIKLGEEVDHLTLIIENGLSAIRGVRGGGPLGEAGSGWLREVAQDLAPAFEAEGRELHVRLCPDAGSADLPSLRAGLLTLLENALYHGAGNVYLESVRSRSRLVLRVTDEGPGLEHHQLAALGRPFMRLRIKNREGFEREGQGLGLSLLHQVALREGWGLCFASGPGKGFTASIEIPAL